MVAGARARFGLTVLQAQVLKVGGLNVAGKDIEEVLGLFKDRSRSLRVEFDVTGGEAQPPERSAS